MKVLIVDDERDIRDSLKELFEEEGYRVSTAANGVEALSHLANEELPSVVILDLIMPLVTGNEVYEQMKSDPRLSGVAVVISTSDPSRAPAGVLTLKKPVDVARLLGVVRHHRAGTTA